MDVEVEYPAPPVEELHGEPVEEEEEELDDEPHGEPVEDQQEPDGEPHGELAEEEEEEPNGELVEEEEEEEEPNGELVEEEEEEEEPNGELVEEEEEEEVVEEEVDEEEEQAEGPQAMQEDEEEEAAKEAAAEEVAAEEEAAVKDKDGEPKDEEEDDDVEWVLEQDGARGAVTQSTGGGGGSQVAKSTKDSKGTKDIKDTKGTKRTSSSAQLPAVTPSSVKRSKPNTVQQTQPAKPSQLVGSSTPPDKPTPNEPSAAQSSPENLPAVTETPDPSAAGTHLDAEAIAQELKSFELLEESCGKLGVPDWLRSVAALDTTPYVPEEAEGRGEGSGAQGHAAGASYAESQSLSHPKDPRQQRLNFQPDPRYTHSKHKSQGASVPLGVEYASGLLQGELPPEDEACYERTATASHQTGTAGASLSDAFSGDGVMRYALTLPCGSSALSNYADLISKDHSVELYVNGGGLQVLWGEANNQYSRLVISPRHFTRFEVGQWDGVLEKTLQADESHSVAWSDFLAFQEEVRARGLTRETCEEEKLRWRSWYHSHCVVLDGKLLKETLLQSQSEQGLRLHAHEATLCVSSGKFDARVQRSNRVQHSLKLQSLSDDGRFHPTAPTAVDFTCLQYLTTLCFNREEIASFLHHLPLTFEFQLVEAKTAPRLELKSSDITTMLHSCNTLFLNESNQKRLQDYFEETADRVVEGYRATFSAASFAGLVSALQPKRNAVQVRMAWTNAENSLYWAVLYPDVVTPPVFEHPTCFECWIPPLEEGQ